MLEGHLNPLAPAPGEAGKRKQKPVTRKTVRGDIQDPHHIGACTPGEGMVANGQGGNDQL